MQPKLIRPAYLLVPFVVLLCVATDQSVAKDPAEKVPDEPETAVLAADAALTTDDPLHQTLLPQLEFQFNVVRAVQKELKNRGFDPQGVDGIWGENTLTALNRYRRENGLQHRNGMDWGTLAHLFGSDYVAWKADDVQSAEASAAEAN